MAVFGRQGSILFLFIILLASCGSKKKSPSLTGEEPVEVGDFINFFPLKTAYQFADTSLFKKEKDSLLIGYKVFTQFVPDSVLTNAFGKTVKPKLYPMARVKSANTYLFVKAIAGDKRTAFVIGFDKKNEFIASLPVLKVDQYQSTQQMAGIDGRFNITKTIIRKNSDGSISDGKDVYKLSNDTKSFELILTDELDDKEDELINPIANFSKKQKYTGDYGSGKMNLVSFRDGKKADRLTFFIHFEKDKGECTGELKGDAIVKTATTAEYRQPGEPCVLQFVFTASTVMVKETGACGSHRGMRCSFDGVYFKKKEPKPKPAKGKTAAGK